jgi:hypothetical protein
MGILDSLLGQIQGGTQPSAAQDLMQRFEQGQGSDEEVHGIHQEVAQRLPPDQYREAAEQALSRLSPDDRASLLSELQGQARKQDFNVPGLHEAQGSPAPGALAGLFSSMHQQQPGILQQLLGGVGGGLGGGAFRSPIGKAAMLGIAAAGMRKLMGGGPRW